MKSSPIPDQQSGREASPGLGARFRRQGARALVTIAGALIASAALISAASSAGWGAPTSIGSLNTAALEGCPFESPDGLTLFFASDRPGGVGGLDIWYSQRASVGADWGPARNAGSPVNSSADDFCPTPTEDGHLYFVSARAGGCGGADIYRARFGPSVERWASFETLGCVLNSAAAEFSPSLVREGGEMVLYFSSGRPGGFAPEAGAAPDHDIYSARMLPGGSFAAPVLVPGVNSAADDARPNVRLDGLELVFDSTRPGGLGGPDVWVASRPSVGAGWSTPVNPGAPINSAAGESRPSLSRTGDRLYFGSGRPGGQGNSDIYVASLGAPAGPAPQAPAQPGIRPPAAGDGGIIAGQPSAPVIAIVALVAGVAALSWSICMRRPSRP